MNNKYSIELGVKLDTSDLKKEIDNIDSKHKVKLGVDLKVNDIKDRIKQYNTNSNNIKVKLGVKLDTDDLKKQIGKLNLNGTSSGKGVAIPVNTQSLEKSLAEVKDIIASVKKSLGTLDDESGMKSLLSSVNQIATALGKATDESETLIKSLNALSKKDFNVNIGLKVGGSNAVANNAAYGNEVRNNVLPQLKKQVSDLVGVYNKEYKKADNEAQALISLVSGTKLGTGNFFNDMFDKENGLITRMNTGSLKGQMNALKEFINLFQKAASLKGLKLDGVLSGLSADELIKNAENIQTGAKGMEDGFETIKQIFGGGNGLDADGISAQLDSIIVDLNEIKTTLQGLSSGISLEGLTTSFDKLSDSIELLVKNCANMKTAINDSVSGLDGSVGGTDSGLEKVENDLKEITITSDNTANAIQSLRNVMASMKFNTSSIDAATKDLKEADIVIEKISAKKGKNFDITIKGVNKLGEAVTVIKRLNDATGKFEVISTQISKPFDEGVQAARRFKKEAETVKNIKFNLDVGKYDDDLSNVYNKFNKLSSASTELRDSLGKVENALREVEEAAKPDADGVINKERLIRAEEEYAKALETTNNLLRIQTREENANNAIQKLQDDREVFQSKIDNWLTQNSAATKQFGAQMLDLKAKAESCDRVELNHLEKEFKKLDNAAEKAGLKMQSFGDRIKTKLKEYSAYLSVAEVFMYAEQGLRSMFEQVKAIDSAMTELKKVTNESDAAYSHFLTNAASRAKELGITIDGVVSSAADFARLGYEFKDVQGLAEVANIYSVVGDEIDSVETATQSLISTMTAFKDEMNGLSDSDFAMNIVDKFNEVSNNFAISSGGIGEALQRSASSMAAANNSLDETIALITAANTVVQDPDAVGTAFKTISMRIRGAKTELEDAGLETDGMVESTAKLRQEIMALSGVDIMLNNNEFKSTYQIMEELANKWQDLSDIQQATVTELIAGKIFCQNVQKCA